MVRAGDVVSVWEPQRRVGDKARVCREPLGWGRDYVRACVLHAMERYGLSSLDGAPMRGIAMRECIGEGVGVDGGVHGGSEANYCV